MKAGQPHSSAAKPVTLSAAQITVKQSTGELNTSSFVEEKNEQKSTIKQTKSDDYQLMVYIVSGSAAYSLFLAASAGLDIKS